MVQKDTIFLLRGDPMMVTQFDPMYYRLSHHEQKDTNRVFGSFLFINKKDYIIQIVLPNDWKKNQDRFFKIIEHEAIHSAILEIEGSQTSIEFDSIFEDIPYFYIPFEVIWKECDFPIWYWYDCDIIY